MGLDDILLALSVTTLVLASWTWRWTVALQRQLERQPGYELVRIVAWIVGWFTLAWGVRTVGVLLFDISRDNIDAAVLLSIAAQILGLIVFVGAAVKLRRLAKAPEDPAREAVVQLRAEGSAEIPQPPPDEWTSVDYLGNSNATLPPELNERPAG